MKRWYWWLLAAVMFASAGAFRLVPEIASQPVFSYVSVVLVALPSLFFLYRWLGAARSAFVFVCLAVFAYAVETIGLLFGVPYGWFSYGSLMGYKVLGVLPVLLPFAFVPLVLGAASLAARVSKQLWVRVLATTGLLLLFDFVLDPGAVALGVWSFAEQGAYYGVPASNFAGWLFSGVIAAVLFFASSQKRFVPRQLSISAFLMLSFYTGVAAFFSLWVPLVLGLVLLGVLAKN